MKDLKTIDDFKALQMSWIFDVNYRRSFDILQERQALRKIYETMSADHLRAEAVYEKTALFLKQRLQHAALRINP